MTATLAGKTAPEAGTLSRESGVEYTPYGQQWIDEGTDRSIITYRFTSKEYDSETGLYYYGVRYLDPVTARWMTPDPAFESYLPATPTSPQVRQQNQNLPGDGGVFNLFNLDPYHYAENNPVRYVDPTGAENNLSEQFKAAEQSAAQKVEQVAQGFKQAGVEIAGGVTAAAKFAYYGAEMAYSHAAAMAGAKTSPLVVYRYVGAGEAAAAKATGYVPNTTVTGAPKTVFYTTGKYSSAVLAEQALQIGSKNPIGPSPSPEYRIAANGAGANFAYTGTVQGGFDIELTTREKLPVLSISPLQP